MTVAELIAKLQEMPQDLPVYWDNSEGMEAEEIKSAYNEMTHFSLHKKENGVFKYVGDEMRDVVILSWREAD